MSKITSLIRRAPKRFAAVVAMVAAAIVVPAAVWAWGPDGVNRPTYTFANPAPHVTFNSITDNPRVGDERNFVRIREDGVGTFTDNATLEPGKVYEVSVYYHNNAKTSLNASGAGIARDAQLRMELPGVVKPGVNAVLAGNISASNAQPKTVWDEAYGKNSTNGDIALRYLSNSATFTSNGKVNGQKLPDSLFTTGAKLGFDAQDGSLPGCNEFAGYVTFKFRVDQPNFTVKKEVNVDGKNWVKEATAQPGATVEYRITYQNTGSNQQDSVSVRDILPAGVNYVAGTSMIANSVTGGQYKGTIDGITTTGYNAGSYQPKGNFYFKFKATLPSKDALKCDDNVFKNVARVTTSSGYKEDDATVKIHKKCEPPVEKKIEVCELKTKKIVSIYEKDFDSSKYSKNLEDCKDVPEKIKVCELKTKQTVYIYEKDFDASKYSKNFDDCKETPPTPPVTPPTPPTTPPELPHTGVSENIVAVIGLGSLVAAISYYVASRRAL